MKRKYLLLLQLLVLSFGSYSQSKENLRIAPLKMNQSQLDIRSLDTCYFALTFEDGFEDTLRIFVNDVMIKNHYFIKSDPSTGTAGYVEVILSKKGIQTTILVESSKGECFSFETNPSFMRFYIRRFEGTILVTASNEHRIYE